MHFPAVFNRTFFFYGQQLKPHTPEMNVLFVLSCFMVILAGFGVTGEIQVLNGNQRFIPPDYGEPIQLLFGLKVDTMRIISEAEGTITFDATERVSSYFIPFSKRRGELIQYKIFLLMRNRSHIFCQEKLRWYECATAKKTIVCCLRIEPSGNVSSKLHLTLT